eukprot:CAMPEP_0170199132 /NCGR_PEP_ID=MMETSP0040_2-20121228/69170_1 /TAXON_ID=641309 /ORGANISM="Lotharella oceanica, Strain CCMP622" /LENGTH=532 /DNA_ID=CAMNT_0010449219 /DNA_START=916 /DNA_END=2511 /DNA_ORIENTATION=-
MVNDGWRSLVGYGWLAMVGWLWLLRLHNLLTKAGCHIERNNIPKGGRELGSGAYAKVLEVTTPKGPMAIKEMYSEEQQEKDSKTPSDLISTKYRKTRRFLEEVKLLCLLRQSQYIVRCFGYHLSNLPHPSEGFKRPQDTKPFQRVMLLEKCVMDLKQFMEKQPQSKAITPFEIPAVEYTIAYKVIVDCARGLADVKRIARENRHPRIIHRDIKPENILIQKVGKDRCAWDAKIADFGVAREILQTMAVTKAGTLPYMPPEARKWDKCNEKFDVWSLGKTMWKLFLGFIPEELNKTIWEFKRKGHSQNAAYLERIQTNFGLDSDWSNFVVWTRRAATSEKQQLPKPSMVAVPMETWLKDLIKWCLLTSVERRPNIETVLKTLLLFRNTMEGTDGFRQLTQLFAKDPVSAYAQLIGERKQDLFQENTAATPFGNFLRRECKNLNTLKTFAMDSIKLRAQGVPIHKITNVHTARGLVLGRRFVRQCCPKEQLWAQRDTVVVPTIRRHLPAGAKQSLSDKDISTLLAQHLGDGQCW